MGATRLALVLAAVAAAGGCRSSGDNPPRPSVAAEASEAWRDVASPRSEQAIDGLAAAWQAALAQTPRARASTPLLQPSAALPRAAPAPGPYRCSATRLAPPAGGKGGTRVTTQKPGFCFVGVTEDQLSFTADAPGARFGGYLWETADSKALVFLGGSAPGAGRPPRGYGDDPAGDVAGLFERIGEFRYRLALAAGAGGEVLIVELVAAPRPGEASLGGR